MSTDFQPAHVRLRPHSRARPGVRALALGLILAAAATPLPAATPIDETRPLDRDGEIDIANLKGSIEVRGWNRAEVRIEGSLGDGVERLEIAGDRDRLSVKVKYPNRGGPGLFGRGDRSEPTHLRLMVPLRADLDIDAVSAGIDVIGVAPGELSIASVSGDITVAAAPDEADIESVSGDLRLTLNSGDVSVQSVSGDITLRGRLDDEVDVETVAGDLDIDVHQARTRELKAASVSGDMRIRTVLAGGGEIELESVSGDIALTLPRDLSALVKAESFSGDLRAPRARIQRPRHGPGASFEHRYGSGDGEVSIETFSGDAALRIE